MLVHGQLVAYGDPQVVSCRAAFQPVSPQYVLLCGVFPPWEQDSVRSFVELHEVPAGVSSWSRSLWLAAQPLGASATPPGLASSANLLRH